MKHVNWDSTWKWEPSGERYAGAVNGGQIGRSDRVMVFRKSYGWSLVRCFSVLATPPTHSCVVLQWMTMSYLLVSHNWRWLWTCDPFEWKYGKHWGAPFQHRRWNVGFLPQKKYKIWDNFYFWLLCIFWCYLMSWTFSWFLILTQLSFGLFYAVFVVLTNFRHLCKWGCAYFLLAIPISTIFTPYVILAVLIQEFPWASNMQISSSQWVKFPSVSSHHKHNVSHQQTLLDPPHELKEWPKNLYHKIERFLLKMSWHINEGKLYSC